VSKRLQTYRAPTLTVTFDPNRCTHSAECLRGLPEVFDTKRKRWIRPELASPDAVAAQVASCPSGALRFRRPGGSDTPPSTRPGPEGPQVPA
jgi:uncharacterized Fe-S cluster protein YjdI